MEQNGNKVSTFKERFSELFNETDQSMTDLARILHVSRQTLGAWISGTRSPKEPTIIAIAQYFRVSVGWLMGFDVPKERQLNPVNTQSYVISSGYTIIPTPSREPKTSEARILARGIDKLPKSQREQALQVVRAMFAKYSDYFTEDKDDDA